MWTFSQGQPEPNRVTLSKRGLSRSLPEKRWAMAHDAQQLCHEDPVTGLPNHAAAVIAAQSALDSFHTLGVPSAVLALRVDNYRLVNDTLGHDSGGAMLIQIARRISDVLAGRGLLAHEGGDEFVVVLPVCQPGEATDISLAVVALLRAPMSLEGVDVSVRASVGIACADDGNRTGTLLMQAADLALLQASDSHGHAVEMFTPTLRASAWAARRGAEAVSQGVRRREFSFHYQPVVDLASGEVVGVEALMRWESGPPDLRTPGRFIDILASLGELTDVTQQLVREALANLRRWRAQRPALVLTVNMHPSAIELPEVVDWLLNLPAMTELPTNALVLEVSESAMASPRAVSHLGQLHRAGIGVWLDDFGTGWSSLAALRELPLDSVKLARPFIFDVDGAVDAEMLTAVVAIAKAAGLDVIAEGIESAQQQAGVQSHGIALGQGFHLAVPMSAAALDRWWTTEQSDVVTLS